CRRDCPTRHLLAASVEETASTPTQARFFAYGKGRPATRNSRTLSRRLRWAGVFRRNVAQQFIGQQDGSIGIECSNIDDRRCTPIKHRSIFKPSLRGPIAGSEVWNSNRS